MVGVLAGAASLLLFVWLLAEGGNTRSGVGNYSSEGPLPGLLTGLGFLVALALAWVSSRALLLSKAQPSALRPLDEAALADLGFAPVLADRKRRRLEFRRNRRNSTGGGSGGAEDAEEALHPHHRSGAREPGSGRRVGLPCWFCVFLIRSKRILFGFGHLDPGGS